MRKLFGLLMWLVVASPARAADDWYKVLGVSPYATHAEIKQAFRALAIKTHPDAHPGASEAELVVHNANMDRLSQAWQVLGDEQRRQEYDMQRLNRRQEAAPSSSQSAPSSSYWRDDTSACRSPLTSMFGGRVQAAMENYLGKTSRLEITIKDAKGARSVLSGPVDRVPNSPFKFRVFTNRFSRNAYRDLLYDEVVNFRVMP